MGTLRIANGYDCLNYLILWETTWKADENREGT